MHCFSLGIQNECFWPIRRIRAMDTSPLQSSSISSLSRMSYVGLLRTQSSVPRTLRVLPCDLLRSDSVPCSARRREHQDVEPQGLLASRAQRQAHRLRRPQLPAGPRRAGGAGAAAGPQPAHQRRRRPDLRLVHHGRGHRVGRHAAYVCYDFPIKAKGCGKRGVSLGASHWRYVTS